MAGTLTVNVVATDKAVWSGEAIFVAFETPVGSIGILPGHSPVMAILKDGPVLIRQSGEDEHFLAAHTGFVVVDNNEVIILAESAELAENIDRAQAEALLAEAEASEESEDKEHAIARAQTRLLVLDKAGK